MIQGEGGHAGGWGQAGGHQRRRPCPPRPGAHQVKVLGCVFMWESQARHMISPLAVDSSSAMGTSSAHHTHAQCLPYDVGGVLCVTCGGGRGVEGPGVQDRVWQCDAQARRHSAGAEGRAPAPGRRTVARRQVAPSSSDSSQRMILLPLPKRQGGRAQCKQRLAGQRRALARASSSKQVNSQAVQPQRRPSAPQ